MPTRPFDHSCAASHAITSQMSACSSAVYSSTAIPPDEPVPRMSSRQTAKPPSSAEALVLGRVGRREVVHPVRERLEHTGAGQLSGSQSRAASRVPSAAVIQARAVLHVPILPGRVGRAVDLRPTPEQATLRAKPPPFARAAAVARGRPGVVAPGNALGRRFGRRQPGARSGGLDRDVVAGGARRARALATHGDARGGGLRLPLAAALARTSSPTRRSARRSSASRSPELVERLLPPIVRGELVFCQGFSEPGAGSDLGSLTTRAERRGDTYVVSGHKIWTSSAQLADWIYLAVRTDPAASKHRGITVLVVPGRHARDRGASLSDARRRHALRDVPRRRRDPRGRTSSARSTAAGRCSCTRSTSSA